MGQIVNTKPAMDVFVQVNDVKTTDRAYRRPISLISPLEFPN